MASWLRSWVYSSSTGRDLRIDWLRGFCLFAMAVDHIGGESFLYVFSGRLNFYISAAEGFYFISGLTLGILASHQTLLQSLERVFLRMLVLYRTAVLIALSFMALSLLGLKVWYDPWDKKQMATTARRFLGCMFGTCCSPPWPSGSCIAGKAGGYCWFRGQCTS